ncbi:MAG: bifunctional 4-hydroxy-3-methylbut-2-enyl diphosphate reductase/30S ribosomal protein S1 [Desulfotomaculum sp.]|nr:bifunctional 4-hydroxy-3-methylbut-2-enyl diphosphate reductase/30S ribosomal protein S1 [Desulfotomaculum sp.]
MKVLVAQKAGFCFGVKRAIDIACKAIEDHTGSIYTLGPIIHNPQVIAELAQKGINEIVNINDGLPGKLIIRSHGVGPEIIEAAREYGHEIIDATCPFVSRAQKLADDLTMQGYQVVVVGDIEHPEVKGIVGWAGGKAIVVKNAVEAGMISSNRLAILAQTTQKLANFNEVVRVFQQKNPEIKVCNTICHATGERQQATLTLAKSVDVIVVVGGVNSANTGKLTELCRNTGAITYQVEVASELKETWFAGVKRAGLTAGASTPGWIIEEVKCRMRELETEMMMDEEQVKTESGQEAVIQEEMAPEEVVAEKNEQEEVVQEEVVQEEAAQKEAVQEEVAPEESEQEENELEEGMQDIVEVKTLHKGEIVCGTVVQVNHDEVLVDVGAKSEGVISLRELTSYNADPHEVVQVGDEINVMVLKTEDNEGRIILSKERVDAEKNWTGLEEAMESGTVMEGVVREVVKGGLLVDVGVRSFLPASLVDVGYTEDLNKYLNETFKVKVIEMNKSRRKVILSRKVVMEEESAKAREELFKNLAVDQVIKGVVRRLTNFGAFVDIGGVDGLLHISEMAWYRIDRPSEVVSVDEEIEVKVLKIDEEKGKISLGLKQVLPNPWDNVEQTYQVDTIIKAKIVRLAPFGAFVQLEPGVEGLIHISHLAEHHVEKPEDVVSEGDTVEVKILSVDSQEKRVRLSISEVNKDSSQPSAKPRKKQAPSQEHLATGVEVNNGNDDEGMASFADSMSPELAEKMAKMAQGS